MKLRIPMLGILMCLLTVPISSRAQEQTQKNDNAITHLRVDIVLTEYNGDKKISTLPYTIYTAAPPQQGPSRLRMGVRVPVPMGGGSLQYMDVGSSIDCFARNLNDGSYGLDIDVSRSSIYAAPKGDTENQNTHAQPDRPVIRNFSSHFNVALRDGETQEGTSAADPLNGNVLKISVTLHVLK